MSIVSESTSPIRKPGYLVYTVLTCLSTRIVPYVGNILGTLLKCQESESFSLPLHCFCFYRKEETLAFTFLKYKYMACAWEDEELGFQTHS